MKKTLLSIITITAFSFGTTAQNVNIPDANFKAYLVGNSSINTNADTEIQVSEASAFTGIISCSGDGIADLTGIEVFTALTILNCHDNSLTTLDVSNNTALTAFYCSSNSLSTLDISNNTDLTSFDCSNNSLTTLDISNNTDLTLLWCLDNLLTTLDVTNNTVLTEFICLGNLLTTLDVSNNTDLTQFRCDNNLLTILDLANGNNTALTLFNAQTNPNLACIQVDDVSYSTTIWTDIDAGASFSTNCNPILVSSITVQGQSGASVITTQGGTLQMEATVLPVNADDGVYTWSASSGTGTAIISASGLLTGITDGNVTVTATSNDASGITGTTVITISNQSVGINQQNTIHNVSIYPNPANSILFIDSDEKINSIEIMDITGNTIKTITVLKNSIDVSDLTKGIYFLQIKTDKGLLSKKFIKE